MYRVYFDSQLQSMSDIMDINDNVITSITREDGFLSPEQILREKFQGSITFTGNAYKYAVAKLKVDPCAIIDVKITKDCGKDINATMDIGMMERTIGAAKCFWKSQLKDNSFSGYIRDYLSVDVQTYNTKTRNCEKIDTVIQNFLMPNDPASPGNRTQIQAFDVSDLMNYIINFHTDNRFGIRSTYLSNKKYAICTGGSLSNQATTIDEIYPTLNYQTLFTEIRKKKRIYQGISTDQFGTQYLSVELESNFFKDVKLFSIPKIPKDSVITYDTKRVFNQIDVGSDTTDLQDGSTAYFNPDRYLGFEKTPFVGCGSCTGDKDSKLDLVSGYIISSDLIFEGINWSGSDYPNKDAIILFEYEVIDGLNWGKVTLDIPTSKYYYNASLTNDSVLESYLDYTGRCIAKQRKSKYGFLATKSDYPIRTDGLDLYNCGDEAVTLNEIYDNEDKLTISTFTGGDPNTPFSTCPPRTDNFTYFTVSETGNYNFKALAQNIRQVSTNDDGLAGVVTPGVHSRDVDYTISILVYDSIGLGSQIHEFSDTKNANDAVEDPVTLSVESGNVALSPGNIVLVYVHITINGLYDPTADTNYRMEYVSFELLSDDFACGSIEYNDENSRPYLLKSDYALTDAQYALIQNNPSGYIEVAGYKQWIKDIEFKSKMISTLELMGNDFIDAT